MSYWNRYARRKGALGVRRPLTPMRQLERWQESYHGVQAKCPACGRWRYCRVLQDYWVGEAVPKLRLQCACGYAFRHDPKAHDHVLERVPGSGAGARGSYQPRGYRRLEFDKPYRG